MKTQELTITIESIPDEYSCESSTLKIEGVVINQYNTMELVKKEFKGIDAEALFSIVREILLREEDKQNE